ncbi:MAG: extracellular solute-binding protein, partial [Oscillospiraceae bacterium]|nr:extracellular solute-binding protein [Oscillospiraceae bacterium]
ISFEPVREQVYISEIKFTQPSTLLSYEQYLAANSGRGTAEIPRIQAEMPAAISEIVIHPINDRTSAATEPQDASRIRLNSIGGTRWQLYGQWVKYEAVVPAGGAGLYKIVTRFKQSVYSGVYSSRRIRINGEIPFSEDNRLRFNFSENWQVEPLNNGETEFLFYLPEGKNIIEFEVSLGDMGEKLGRVEESLLHMSSMYRDIRMLTGSQPDSNRDYGFERLLPLVLTGLRDESEKLRSMSAELEDIIGSKGEHTVILDRIALQMERMSNNVDRIAPGLDTFNGNIGGLGTWLLERRQQPLEIDYIQITRENDALPRAEANFFQAIAFEFISFIMSFFSDYDSVGVMEESDGQSESVEVWLGSSTAIGSIAGRDQAQIIRQMAVNFTQQTNVQTNIKLVAGGSLLPSVLAGVGPDVALYNGAGDAINFAIRSAVQPLNHYQADHSRNIAGFDEVKNYFHPSALEPLTLRRDDDPEKDGLVFGLPENQTFQMMFYRKDVLVELGIELPKTWYDLYDMVPELQKLNLEVGILPDNGMVPLQLFMYQNNVPLYNGDGISINLDDNFAIESFKRMTELYTIYKFPVDFNFANRFRSGEMPIGLAGYDLYNQLTVFAPEIRGLWEFVPVPGTVREKTPADEGKGFEELGAITIGRDSFENAIIDNKSLAGVSTSLMMRSAYNRDNMDNAWAFMQWWVGADAQSRFGNEMIALMGAAAKQPTANLEALENMAWPTTDFRNLREQFNFLSARPEVPGGYIVDRYVDFAWRSVYNDGDSAVESILEYIVEINKELTRKRQEFDMPVVERDRFGKIIEPQE